MIDYEISARRALNIWQRKMLQRPGIFNNFSRSLQGKVNSYIPEKIHNAITVAIKHMVKTVLLGARFTSPKPKPQINLFLTEVAVKKKIEFYKKTAAVEGGVTGAGGILLGFVDFPVLIGIKIKLLSEIASLYGFDLKNYKERVYMLHIFELAFSSDLHRKTVYLKMTDWAEKEQHLVEDINQFDWRNFQQEYRDYLDLAKMAQLIPVIGAPVGLIVNYRLLKKLGITAMNAYRMRIFRDLPQHKKLLTT